jgi:hypothetical protein
MTELPGRTFQLFFFETGDTGVLSSSAGAPGFMGATDVSMKGLVAAALDVVCFTKVEGEAGVSAGADGVVVVDISNRYGTASRGEGIWITQRLSDRL